MFPRPFQDSLWDHSGAKGLELTPSDILFSMRFRNSCFQQSTALYERFIFIPSDAEFNPEQNNVNNENL
jgi:hypothetical protein